MVNAATRCFKGRPAGPTSQHDAHAALGRAGGSRHSRGDLLCSSAVTSIACQRSCLPPSHRARGVPRHLQRGQNLCRFWFGPGSFSALRGCVCWFIHQQSFAHSQNYLTFPSHAVAQQYRGILKNESSGPCCFLFSKSTGL